jgi:23S rRNA (uracil1939-C5)-methyltransferase
MRRAVLRIAALGGHGDGIGELDGRPVFVPFAAPGDLVDVAIEGPKGEGLAARLVETKEAGPGHVPPPCRHFGDCGGCAVQQLDETRYLAWKATLLPAALARRGLVDAPIRPLIRIAPRTRRRAALAAVRQGGRVLLGFHARAGRRVVDLGQCEILLPELARLLPPLRVALHDVVAEGRSADVLLAWTLSGADLLVASTSAPDLAGRQALAALAETADLARVCWSRPGGEPEPIALRRPPVLSLGGTTVRLPPGPFLQPSAEGEAALVAAVLEAAGAAKAVADLFAGCGTFSFPLAATGARLHAVEGAAPAIEALAASARAAGQGATVTTERRDLDERPLLAAELARFDAVVFDPPRAGARAQAEMLAISRVPRAVAVSCNPATFARDARILIDGGYRLDWVQPVDQFPWTGHLELVGSFSR